LTKGSVSRGAPTATPPTQFANDRPCRAPGLLAALGTLVPADAALGGNLQSYVDGLHHALIASAALAIAGAIVTAWLLVPAGAAAEAEAVTKTA
jgi:hypothetical protein